MGFKKALEVKFEATKDQIVETPVPVGTQA